MNITRKAPLFLICLMAVLGIAFGAAFAYAPSTGDKELDSRLDAVNAYAAKNPDAFVAGLSATYHVDEQAIRDSLAKGLSPADVYMSLRLGMLTGTPPADLEKSYLSNPGKGWGVIAKSLGIKPGSKEFKSLKSGAEAAAGKGKSSGSGMGASDNGKGEKGDKASGHESGKGGNGSGHEGGKDGGGKSK